jgi:hypothetical protein
MAGYHQAAFSCLAAIEHDDTPGMVCERAAVVSEVPGFPGFPHKEIARVDFTGFDRYATSGSD